MPAPLVWLGIAVFSSIAGKVVYDSYNDSSDGDDREYERRKSERKAERARKAEEKRLAKERQQRLTAFAEQQLEGLVDRYDLIHQADDQLVGLALENHEACKQKLLTMYDEVHAVDSEIERDQQTIRTLRLLSAKLEESS